MSKRFPRSPCTGRQGRCPALPLQHRFRATTALSEASTPRSVRPAPRWCSWHMTHQALPRPRSTRLEPLTSRGASTTGSVSLHLPVLLAGPGCLMVPTRPYVVRAAPARPRTPGVRLPSASPGRCGGPGWASQPTRYHGASWRTADVVNDDEVGATDPGDHPLDRGVDLGPADSCSERLQREPGHAHALLDDCGSERLAEVGLAGAAGSADGQVLGAADPLQGHQRLLGGGRDGGVLTAPAVEGLSGGEAGCPAAHAAGGEGATSRLPQEDYPEVT